MRILVLNAGSSSLKGAVVDTETGRRLASGKVERIADGGHAAALATLVDELDDVGGIEAIGHRVVHGGTQFSEATPLTDDVIAAVDALTPLAPLHLPANLAAIRAAREHFPGLPQVAVFDTAFHSSLPRRASTYALPTEVANQHGVRRYGFHGPSHAYVARRAAEHLGEDLRDLRVITLHLGNGASACAIEFGRSIETSMGMTPVEGLVMGTRAGDVDAGALIAIARAEGLDLDGLDNLVNKQSGLAGLSGVGNDLRDIEARAAEGDDRCRLALSVYAHRVRKYIGAYAAVLGGADAIVFTGGIGENSAAMRHRAAQHLQFLGARLDEDANRDARVDVSSPVAEISSANSRCRLLVVKTDEEGEIARAAAQRLAAAGAKEAGRVIPVAISARHVHLSREHIDVLFGEGYALTPKKELTQPGQFACVERITLVGPKSELERVGIIGPERSQTQVEISRTDEFALGIDAPIRMSGDIAGSAGLTLRGPKGEVTLVEGVIQSQRHIHMTPDDAQRYGVQHKDIVEVAIDSAGRDLVFGDVVVRVKDSYKLEMHVDTDEGNAADLCRGHEGVLYGTEGRVRSLRKQPR
ncbi:MAG: acetate/propionate family kinase [Deltaproteobacteria bacterium]|nr:MAG: acetate/propionate family kinase [Deltaproteobacteria bacterium]